MAEGWQETAIRGVFHRQGQVYADERGAFSELWRASWTEGLLGGRPFVQSNLSRSRAGVLRGMHFHLRQTDLWVVVEGRALVATADLRSGRPERVAVQTLTLETDGAVLIPERVAHGFLALTDLALVYLVTNEFDGSDELGFAWDDPDARIPWPAREPILSQRDRSNPSLADALAGLAQPPQTQGR
jgi:dTDP-4-dehydrorhamnose 3,5-epimerase